MIENNDMPLGFTMNLAQNMKALGQFAGLTKEEKENVVDGAKAMKSRDEMKLYVDSIAKSEWTR